MKLDGWTMLFLVRRDDPPKLDKATDDTVQDAHLAYLASLHGDGRLLAAGPVRGGPGNPIAGICILRCEVEEARSLLEADPAVRAGLYRVDVVSWFVPEGTIAFRPSRFPRSRTDVDAP
jgi:hypothetical protein